ncbi:uncharacterized protein [Narcine bancroftii]|uniref:uncharacterized protein isoform X2 n=1 Tax=Narcine bancroftii TaxID=1343680 RepID=UPI003831BD9C
MERSSGRTLRACRQPDSGDPNLGFTADGQTPNLHPPRGTLAVLTGSDISFAYPTSRSNSTPDLETVPSFNSSSEETLTSSSTMATETMNSSKFSNGDHFVFTKTSNNGNGSQIENSTFSLNGFISYITDNISISSTTDSFTDAGTVTNQTSDREEHSAATATSMSFTVTSTSKVFSSQEVFIISTPNSTAISQAKSNLELTLIIAISIVMLITILLLMAFWVHKRKRRYSFELNHKTAEDANIPLSSPILQEGFELTPVTGKESNVEVEKVNEDKTNHCKASAPNASEEMKEKQNCETEMNHSPVKVSLGIPVPLRLLSSPPH